MLRMAPPLVRVKPKDLIAAAVQRVPRVAGVRDGLPLLDDGRVLDVRNVIWCTGFRTGFSWIALPILGDRQEPTHERGVVAQPARSVLRRPALPVLGDLRDDHRLPRDAKRIAKHVAART